MAKLTGKVAAVTGGASGIGAATVRRCVAEGAAVAFADRDGARGQALADELTAKGGQVLFLSADFADATAAPDFIAAAVAHFGRLDILVNNAGIRLYQSVVEATPESWDTILAVNLKSYALCAKAAIPHMRRAGGGCIVNVGSVRSLHAGGNTLQYDTTKAAIGGLTRGLAMDHSAEGIRVNAVCPGPIFTPFHAARNAATGRTQAQYDEDAARQTMIRRAGTPDEVAACIVFMASPDASYVTGASLFVDGGMTAM